MVVFEGPDGVGKTTLAKRLGGQQDRSWLSCMIYRFGIPKHNWSNHQVQWPKATANDDLVVITYDNNTYLETLEKYAYEHDYSPMDLYRVNKLYEMYVESELCDDTRSYLWRSVTHFKVEMTTRKYILMDFSPCYMCTEEEIRDIQKQVWAIESCMTQS